MTVLLGAIAKEGAGSNTRMVKALIKHSKKASLSARTWLQGKTALHLACYSNCSVDMVKFLASHGADLNWTDSMNSSTFRWRRTRHRSNWIFGWERCLGQCKKIFDNRLQHISWDQFMVAAIVRGTQLLEKLLFLSFVGCALSLTLTRKIWRGTRLFIMLLPSKNHRL